MAFPAIVDTLRQAAIFQGLQPAQLAALARHAERMKFAPGDIITRAGDAGDGAYLLVAGIAERVAAPGDRPEAVQPGSLIGQLAMLIEHNYGSTVLACERVLCLKITRLGLQAQMATDPSLAQHLERHVTERLLAVAQRLREIDGLLRPRTPAATPDRSRLGLPRPAQSALDRMASPGS
jgi:CRP/FNR family cyclic AMP-dependent transcriptional regulator